MRTKPLVTNKFCNKQVNKVTPPRKLGRPKSIKNQTTNEQIDFLLLKFFTNDNKIPYDWHYGAGINYDSNYIRNCRESGCNDEGICRCGKYEDFKITSFDANAFIDTLNFKISNDLVKYCIDRIVRIQNISPENFNAQINGSYYGEEIDAIYLDHSVCSKLYKKIFKLKKLADIDKIKYLLELEYGYILDSIKNLKHYNIKEIDMSTIKKSDHYTKKILEKDLNNYDEVYKLPRGIFIDKTDYCPRQYNEFNYKLIDGYHRLLSAEQMGMKTIVGIVLS